LIITWPEAGSRLFFSYPPNQEVKIGIETNPTELKNLFSTGKRATLDQVCLIFYNFIYFLTLFIYN